jgi:hypothetical protein
MLNLSEMLIQNPELESFDELVEKVRTEARTEVFSPMVIQPPYPDTPIQWEPILEAVFSRVTQDPQNTQP